MFPECQGRDRVSAMAVDLLNGGCAMIASDEAPDTLLRAWACRRACHGADANRCVCDRLSLAREGIG